MEDSAIGIAPPPSPTLSAAQLATLAELGEERTAAVGEVLYRVGDRRYPFIAIIEGEVAILDAAGHEIVRHGASGFLGEMNLLSGQTVFVTAVVTQPLRYIAVDRERLRPLLYEDGPLSDLLLSTFIARREALQQVQGVGLEIIGPHSSERDAADARLRATQPPAVHLARPGRDGDRGRGRARRGLDAGESSAGEACRAASSFATRPPARSRARSGSGASSRPARRSIWSSSGPARPASAPPSTAPRRASTRSSSRARRSAGRRARRGGSRTTSASPPASAARSSRAARSRRHASSTRAPRRPIARSALEPGDGAPHRPPGG